VDLRKKKNGQKLCPVISVTAIKNNIDEITGLFRSWKDITRQKNKPKTKFNRGKILLEDSQRLTLQK
jgi:hypothetical protein